MEGIDLDLSCLEVRQRFMDGLVALHRRIIALELAIWLRTFLRLLAVPLALRSLADTGAVLILRTPQLAKGCSALRVAAGAAIFHAVMLWADGATLWLLTF